MSVGLAHPDGPRLARTLTVAGALRGTGDASLGGHPGLGIPTTVAVAVGDLEAGVHSGASGAVLTMAARRGTDEGAEAGAGAPGPAGSR